MAVIKVSQKTLCELSKISQKEAEPILTELGIPIDKIEDGEMHLEITPNRPDWLSVEGLARSCESYKFSKVKKYTAKKSKISLKIDASVKKIRPVFAGAYITNAHLTSEILDSLIQLQEKIHDTLGRNRKKVAIGIHDAKNISSPFTYKAIKSTEMSFIPLSMSKPLNCAQILSQHETGKKYAHLVKGKCPIILDKTGQVLSFPPIINGELTKVTQNSTDLFIDCTGTHEKSVLAAVSIICAALADRGCTIHTIQINSKECDIFKNHKTHFKLNDANKLLGTSISAAQAKKHLARLGHSLEGAKVLSPAFRTDILHPVDLIEDMAISIGYNNFEPQHCDISTIGKKEDSSNIHQTCLGLGYFEVSSWILTNQIVLENSKVDMSNSLEVQNPLTREFTTMRPMLYPNLLEIFSKSKSQTMPQNLYELGDVVRQHGSAQTQKRNLCLASAHPKSNFSQIQGELKALLDSLGVAYSLIETDIDGFISGRCAKISIDSKDSGLIGEIHPEVLEKFSIEQPVSLFEIDSKSL